VTGCVLCDSLTWPSLQLKKETVDNQSHKDNLICLCKKKKGVLMVKWMCRPETKSWCGSGAEREAIRPNPNSLLPL
jgi:hypothetical protein